MKIVIEIDYFRYIKRRVKFTGTLVKFGKIFLSINFAFSRMFILRLLATFFMLIELYF